MNSGPPGHRRTTNIPAPHTRLLHRHSHADLPIAVGGDGPYVIDNQGNRYLDASGGAAVSCLGYSDAEIIAAIERQSQSLAYIHSAFFTSEPMEQLADVMVAGAPAGIVDLLAAGDVQLDSETPEPAIESDEVGVVEATIAPRSSLIGQTLGGITFRERYGLQVLAIWREDRPIRTGLATVSIEFGDVTRRYDVVVADPTTVLQRHIGFGHTEIGGQLGCLHWFLWSERCCECRQDQPRT